MYKQIDVFDFIEKPHEYESTKGKTLFESLFVKIENPVTQCANCLCDNCANNVEELWKKVQPEEQKAPCFNCDKCREFTGETIDRLQKKEECTQFVLTNYAAEKQRKKIKAVN